MALHVRGVLIPDDEVRDLWLVNGRVSLTPVPDAVTIADRGFILPGLVDAHCHIGIRGGGAPVDSLDEARELALVDRAAGVLAIRDAGSPYPYPELDDDHRMPRLARAGRHIAPPRRYLRDIGAEVSAEELPATVRAQARAGNGWVKLVGDWISRDAGDLAPAWDAAVMAEAVATAHRAGARVAVHAFAEEPVGALIRAGVDSVEHGTGLSDADIAEMARRGTALVPTMINVATFGGIADRAREKFPRYADHMIALRDRSVGVVARAHAAGVPIYVGTDAGGGITHGQVVEEMLLLHERAGMSRLETLAAGSWRARRWLGFAGAGLASGPASGPASGSGPAAAWDSALVDGDLADLVVYDDDPRRDLRVLRTPRHIVLRGELC